MSIKELISLIIFMDIKYFFVALILCFAFGNTSAFSEVKQPDIDVQAIVSVKVKGRKDFCSGVVVAPNQILTATHCVYSLSQQAFFPAKAIRIGIGENMFTSNFYWVNVSELSVESDVRIETVNDFLTNDVVRLITSEPLNMQPLKIATSINAKSSFFAWGFGEDQWGYYGIRKSRLLEEPSIENKFISFMAGACRGDSGGPIVDNEGLVVGIVSMSAMQHCVNKGRRLAQRVD